MVQIQELKGLNIEAIVSLLLEEKEQPFEIYIPKSTQKFFSEPQAIWLDYIYLAYTGQLLYDISDEFSYDEISTEEHASIGFTIKTSGISKLAETLLYISYGYVNDNEDEEFNYTEYADDYIDRVKKGEIVPACPYFVAVCNEIETEEKEGKEKNDDE